MLPSLDIGIAIALLSTGLGVTIRGTTSSVFSPIITAIGVIILLISFAFIRGSLATSCWLSKAHLAPHMTAASARATSLRHKRHAGRNLPCPYPGESFFSHSKNDYLMDYGLRGGDAFLF